ncbi:uncharacterized protein BDZ83DRAFT_614684 [Colletotrichum acutatum]|uniref:Uncharacterized protein n=1 Tax=Glomerella acutata TaxID=27357 RepID=A0AAD8UTC9_GLOAC|nr:uncharacterized protein BDZ83DRAFT_614684 [Colletotrichum acutatum]KAK1726774.1 hypothetical protein BDZ83DRAFT_614684 [Colletotrichum acutatum]
MPPQSSQASHLWLQVFCSQLQSLCRFQQQLLSSLKTCLPTEIFVLESSMRAGFLLSLLFLALGSLPLPPRRRHLYLTYQLRVLQSSQPTLLYLLKLNFPLLQQLRQLELHSRPQQHRLRLVVQTLLLLLALFRHKLEPEALETMATHRILPQQVSLNHLCNLRVRWIPGQPILHLLLLKPPTRQVAVQEVRHRHQLLQPAP